MDAFARTFDRFFDFHRLGGPVATDPSGSVAYACWDFNGQPNLWAFPLNGGDPSPVTTFENDGRAVRAFAVDPMRGRILLAIDQAGRENQQLFLHEPGRPGLKRLTRDGAVQWLITSLAWDPEGRRFAAAANERSRAYLDVLIWRLGADAPERVDLPDGYHRPVAWSPDGRWLSVVRIYHDSNTDVLLVDTETGQVRNLTPHDGDAYFVPGPWLPSGESFYMLSNHGREFTGLYLLSRDGTSSVTAAPDWDVEEVASGSAGVAWTVNQSGWSRLWVAESGGEAREVPLGPGVVSQLAWSHDGSSLLFLRDEPSRPSELWIWRPGDDPGPIRNNASGAGTSGAEPVPVAYQSRDGLRIHAWWYRAGERAAPTVIVLHGGPEAQERPRYTGSVQVLLRAGVNVLIPNGRGSTGYGRSYQQAVYRDWGGGDLDDLAAGVAFVRADAVSDGRVALLGGSYGGFLVLSALTRRPELNWTAGVAIDPPSDLVAFLREAPPSWRQLLTVLLGDPENDRAMLEARSPIHHVDRMNAPLLLLHGGNDPRVSRTQSDRLATALEALGRPVTYRVFEEEGHGFVRRQNARLAARLALEFLLSALGRPAIPE